MQVHRRLVTGLCVLQYSPTERDPGAHLCICNYMCMSENREATCSNSTSPCVSVSQIESTSGIIPLLALLTPTTHTHTTGFHPHVSPLQLFLILRAQEWEGGWWGRTVYQWCDVFEQCLPPGDERMRWGDSVCMRERKTEKDKEKYSSPAGTEYTMLPKNSVQIQRGANSSSPLNGSLTTKAVLVSWCHAGISPRAIKQHLSANKASLPKAPLFGSIQPEQPACCSGTGEWGNEKQHWRWSKFTEHTHTHSVAKPDGPWPFSVSTMLS